MTNIAVTKVINQVGPDRPRVSCGKSLGGAHDRRVWRISRELGGQRTSVALQIPAHEQSLARAQLRIHLGDVRIEPGRIRSGPGKTASIQPVSSWTIGVRERIERSQGVRVVATAPGARARANRVHAGNLRRCECLNPAARTFRVAGAVVADATCLEGSRWHSQVLLLILLRFLSFIIQKEENLILLDRAAESCSKRVANQLTRPVWQSCRNFRRLIEPVIGVPNIIAVVFVNAAMKIVGAALRYQRDLSARRSSAVSVGVRRCDPKLFYGIQG